MRGEQETDKSIGFSVSKAHEIPERQGFSRTRRLMITLPIFIILLGVLVYGLNAGTSVFSNVFGTVSAPLLTAGTNTTEGAKEFLNLDGMSKEELKALYNDLSEENQKLREQLVDYYTLKDENASYENILSVKKAMPDLQLAAGSVVGRDPNDVFGDFTVNCGSLAGVSVGDAVITETGVVGVVEEVYAASSRVRSILSEKTQIGATDKSCKESGVVTSDIQFANSGKVKMLYLTRDTEVQPGSIITTSGAGGVFPGDLLIGRVDSVERSNADSSYYAILTPYVDVTEVTDVFVVTDFDGKGDVTTGLPETNNKDEEDPAQTASKGNE